MQETSQAGNAERRRFFRIDEEVCLAVAPIDPGDEEARLTEFRENEHAFSIRNDYNFQIQQHIADFHQIEHRMPELARYLAVLEKQIDRITQRLIDDETSAEELRRKTVNLSAQGIAFHAEQKLRNDSLVEMNLKLLPSGQRLVIIARVILADADVDPEHGGYKVSLDFEHMQEADREILIKHIHGKQMEALGRARED